LSYQGPTQLCFENQEIQNQGPAYHREGFGTPVGLVRGPGKSAAELTVAELEQLGFRPGQKGRMEFQSGVVVEGELVSREQRAGKNVILSFRDCGVKWGDEVLFDPSWGMFDMACGAEVVSVFGGAADRSRYLAATGGFKQVPGKPKTNLTKENQALNKLYAEVRKIRNEAGRELSASAISELAQIHEVLERNHGSDWLLRYELLELDSRFGLKSSWVNAIRSRLEEIALTAKDKREMIQRGLMLL
jgi:phenylalanine-4-hydroxylase